jgi:hypothetical protein
VAGTTYEFLCPPGTRCGAVAGIDYPVCQ